MAERLISLALIYHTLRSSMLRYLPKWLMRRANTLWDTVGSRKFTFAEAEKALAGDDSRMVAVLLSELKRSGWLEVGANADNARKKLYRFTHPETMKEVAKIEIGD
jgi:hypothetical protein